MPPYFAAPERHAAPFFFITIAEAYDAAMLADSR